MIYDAVTGSIWQDRLETYLVMQFLRQIFSHAEESGRLSVETRSYIYRGSCTPIGWSVCIIILSGYWLPRQWARPRAAKPHDIEQAVST